MSTLFAGQKVLALPEFDGYLGKVAKHFNIRRGKLMTTAIAYAVYIYGLTFGISFFIALLIKFMVIFLKKADDK